jgi:hypothetical protein
MQFSSLLLKNIENYPKVHVVSAQVLTAYRIRCAGII